MQHFFPNIRNGNPQGPFAALQNNTTSAPAKITLMVERNE
jgi:hypothetical protein